jgi:hypothetical protein
MDYSLLIRQGKLRFTFSPKDFLRCAVCRLQLRDLCCCALLAAIFCLSCGATLLLSLSVSYTLGRIYVPDGPRCVWNDPTA